jgi:hypothetical protein
MEVRRRDAFNAAERSSQSNSIGQSLRKELDEGGPASLAPELWGRSQERLRRERITPKKTPFYERWVRQFLHAKRAVAIESLSADLAARFLEDVSGRQVQHLAGR